MSRFVLEIQYDGTKYSGWQMQSNAVSIQAILQNAITRLTGQPAALVASGRTDAGVHAISQIVHFDSDTKIQPEKLCSAINAQLYGEDIIVKKSYLVDDNFHARYSAKQKTYLYKMYVCKTDDVFLRNRYLRLESFPDIDLMNSACQQLIGEKDFKCFCASNSSVRDTVRIITDAHFERINDEIFFYITGNGFLYNMVRIIVGTLIDVGYGKRPLTDINAIILSKDRKNASKTAAACGLYLYKVKY